MAVTFTRGSVEKIRQAIRDTESWRLNRGGERLPGGPIEDSFLALITGMGIETAPTPNVDNQRFVYSFVRLTPCGDDRSEVDLWKGPLAYKFTDLVGHIHEAQELNNNPVSVNEIVRMTLVGYFDRAEPTGQGGSIQVRRPRFVFSHQPPVLDRSLPLHDHRDNYHGGFSFAVFHPGTGLPQMPWAL